MSLMPSLLLLLQIISMLTCPTRGFVRDGSGLPVRAVIKSLTWRTSLGNPRPSKCTRPSLAVCDTQKSLEDEEEIEITDESVDSQMLFEGISEQAELESEDSAQDEANDRVPWYTIQCWFGKEDDVKSQLLDLAKGPPGEGRIIDVYYPTAQVLRMRGSTLVLDYKRVAGGFVFVRARMNSAVKDAILALKFTYGFIGGHTPMKLTKDKVMAMEAVRYNDGGYADVLAQNFVKGDIVEVTEGHLKGQQGELRSVRRSLFSVVFRDVTEHEEMLDPRICRKLSPDKIKSGLNMTMYEAVKSLQERNPRSPVLRTLKQRGILQKILQEGKMLESEQFEQQNNRRDTSGKRIRSISKTQGRTDEMFGEVMMALNKKPEEFDVTLDESPDEPSLPTIDEIERKASANTRSALDLPGSGKVGGIDINQSVFIELEGKKRKSVNRSRLSNDEKIKQRYEKAGMDFLLKEENQKYLINESRPRTGQASVYNTLKAEERMKKLRELGLVPYPDPNNPFATMNRNPPDYDKILRELEEKENAEKEALLKAEADKLREEEIQDDDEDMLPKPIAVIDDEDLSFDNLFTAPSSIPKTISPGNEDRSDNTKRLETMSSSKIRSDSTWDNIAGVLEDDNLDLDALFDESPSKSYTGEARKKPVDNPNAFPKGGLSESFLDGLLASLNDEIEQPKQKAKDQRKRTGSTADLSFAQDLGMEVHTFDDDTISNPSPSKKPTTQMANKFRNVADEDMMDLDNLLGGISSWSKSKSDKEKSLDDVMSEIEAELLRFDDMDDDIPFIGSNGISASGSSQTALMGSNERTSGLDDRFMLMSEDDISIGGFGTWQSSEKKDKSISMSGLEEQGFTGDEENLRQALESVTVPSWLSEGPEEEDEIPLMPKLETRNFRENEFHDSIDEFDQANSPAGTEATKGFPDAADKLERATAHVPTPTAKGLKNAGEEIEVANIPVVHRSGTDLQSMNVVELVAMCKAKGIKTSNDKNVLIERLNTVARFRKYDQEELETMTMRDLQELCKSISQPFTGLRKPQLVDNLLSALKKD